MPEITISPLVQAVRRLLSRVPVASRLASAEWEAVRLGLRERALWSAKVESLRVVGEIQAKLQSRIGMAREQVAHGEAWVGRDDFIADVRRMAIAEGVQTSGEGAAGTVRDIRSNPRLRLIYDFQTRQAAEYARWKVGADQDVLDAFPAQELIREEARQVPRDWRARWAAAGGRFYGSGARMIALKTDPVWTGISRFGTPFPPYDFGSGMGVEDVSREEAEALGLAVPMAIVSPALRFNADLQASVGALTPELQGELLEAFGDQVEIVGGVARWRGTAA